MILGYYGHNRFISDNVISYPTVLKNEVPRFSKESFINEILLNKLEHLLKLLEWNVEHNIKFYRVNLDELYPFMDKLSLVTLPKWNKIQQKFTEIGNYIKSNDIRLTVHSSMNTILGSDKDYVTKASIRRLNGYSIIFDFMGLPDNDFYCINTHIGTTVGSKESSINRFATNFEKLYQTTQNRLVVENDDKSSMYSIRDLLEVHKKIGIPITLDYLHHSFNNDSISEKEALDLILPTWKTVPKVHLTSSIINENINAKNKRKHADYLYEKFETYDLVEVNKIYGMIESNLSLEALLQYEKKYNI